jgi:hypothetical protein
MIKNLTYSLLLFFIILAACTQDKMPLPVPHTTNTSFGANDTNYVELSPIWDAANLGVSFGNPQDIAIGRDGIIYVADKANDRIHAFSKAGQKLNDHGLGDLIVEHPQSVSIDSKLNVFFTNGSKTIYCWNQYLNFIDVDSVADSGRFYDPENDVNVELTFTEFVERLTSGGSALQLRELLFRKDDALLETIRSIYPIYTANEDDAQINGVAAGNYGSELFYATESTYDKISEFALAPEYAAKTSFGSVLFRYQALRIRDIASFGSGAGTVDDPWAIEVDAEGDLYFTQLGGNFRVQKLTAPNFESAYTLGVHDIMDLDRFDAPMDIALDDLNDIFVVDAGNMTVSKFDNGGRRAGQEAKLGAKGLATTEFEDGRGIMVEDNIVYIVESGENRIRRFQYSVSDSDVPDDDKKP